MLKNKFPKLIELEQDVNDIHLRNRRDPEKAKQLAALRVHKLVADNPGLDLDHLIDTLEDQAQEEQDFSVFGIVEILREYTECSNSH